MRGGQELERACYRSRDLHSKISLLTRNIRSVAFFVVVSKRSANIGGSYEVVSEALLAVHLVIGIHAPSLERAISLDCDSRTQSHRGVKWTGEVISR